MNKQIKSYLNKVLGIFFILFVVLFTFELFLPAKITRVEKVLGNGTKDKITIEFDRLMDNFSVEENLVFMPEIDVEKIWNGKNLTITFNEQLIENQSYFLKIEDTAKSFDGKSLGKDFELEFLLPESGLLVKKYDGEKTTLYLSAEINGSRKNFDLPLKIKDLVYDELRQKFYFLGHSTEVETVDEFTLSYSDPNQLYEFDLKSEELKVIASNVGYDNKRLVASADKNKLALARIKKSDDGENLSRIKIYVSGVDRINFLEFNGGNAEGLDFMFTPDSAGLVFRNKDGNFELKNVDQIQEGFYVGEFSDVLDFHPFRPEVVFTKYDQSDIFSMKNDLIVFGSDGTQRKLKLPVGVVKEAKYSMDGKSLFIIFSQITDQINDFDSFYPLRVYHVYEYNLENDEFVQLTNDKDFSEEGLVVDRKGSKLFFLQFAKSELMEVDPEYRDLFESIGDKIQTADLIEFDLKLRKSVKIESEIKNFLIF